MSLTPTPEFPWRLQTDLTYVSGVISAAPIQQFYSYAIVDDTGSVVATVPSTPPSLTVDLVDKAASTVVFNGDTYSYGEAIGVMQMLLAQERALQLAPPAAPA